MARDPTTSWPITSPARRAGQAAQLFAERDPAAANANLPGIERPVRDALDAMRDMIGSLRTPARAAAAHAGGGAGLRELVAETTLRHPDASGR